MDDQDTAFARGVIGLQIPQAAENTPFFAHVGKSIAFRQLRLQSVD